MKRTAIALLLFSLFSSAPVMAMPTVAEYHQQTMNYFAEISESLFASSGEGYELWDQILSEADRVRVEEIRDYASRNLQTNPDSAEFAEIKDQAEKILKENAMVTEALEYKRAIASGQVAYESEGQPGVIDIKHIDAQTVDVSDATKYDIPTPSIASKTNNVLTSVSKIYEYFNKKTQPMIDECVADPFSFMSRHYGQHVTQPCMQVRIEALSGFMNVRQVMTPEESAYFAIYMAVRALDTFDLVERGLAEQHVRQLVAMHAEDLKLRSN